MDEPIKPFAWLVIDKEDGCEYGNMHPDYGRDCCHEHIKDAQEAGIPHARRWVVREVFSREQVEQATAELRAEHQSVLDDWNALVEASGSPTNGGAIGHVQALRAERDALRQIVGDYPPIEAELREVSDRAFRAEAECDALRAELARLTTPNLYWIDGGESQVAEELCELADNIAADISGDDRECTVTVGCARELPSMQMRVWIDDEGSMDYDTAALPDVKEATP